jgi:hypothetical protein
VLLLHYSHTYLKACASKLESVYPKTIGVINVVKEFYVLSKLHHVYKDLEPSKFGNEPLWKSLNMHLIEEVPLGGE